MTLWVMRAFIRACKTLWSNIWWYLPGAKSLLGIFWALVGHWLQSMDDNLGAYALSVWMRVEAFLQTCDLGVIWALDFFCKGHLVWKMCKWWFDLWVSMCVVRICLLIKGHIWSASR